MPWHATSSPCREYVQLWYGQTSARAWPVSVRQICEPRWRHTLWNARIRPSSPRITSTGDVSTVSVRKSPGFGISNANPAKSQPCCQIARHLGRVEIGVEIERARHAVAVAAQIEEGGEIGAEGEGASDIEGSSRRVYARIARRSGSYSGRVWRTAGWRSPMASTSYMACAGSAAAT